MTIVGDSLLNRTNEKDLSRYHTVQVKTTLELNKRYSREKACQIKPAVRRKPDVLIIHAATNDFNNNIDTTEVLLETIKPANEEIPETEIAVSTLITDSHVGAIVGQRGRRETQGPKASDESRKFGGHGVLPGKNFLRPQPLDWL